VGHWRGGVMKKDEKRGKGKKGKIKRKGKK
jgi:hypothetical protein